MAALEVLVFYVPEADTDTVLSAVFDAGAGRLGNYDRCAFVTSGRGQFRPLTGANPTIGEVGDVTQVAEDRVEVTYDARLREAVLAALRSAHPYEEPAYHVIESPVRS